ncbi:MAG: hypothetical protein HW406_1066 [Candidatus Brocadiaceae bacterium]|nr:hypothetical protein [Candidatus Brocadiaceae bacterium]
MKHGIFIAILLIFYGNTASGFLSGPIAGRTGAPNDICNDLTCNMTPCHDSYGLNTGKATFSITAPSTYEKGKTTNIVVKFTNANTSLHGFEITAMDTTNTKVGTFTSINDTTQTESYLNQYAAHTIIGTAESSWTIQWSAPSENVSGPITFYAAGNEANGNSLSSGDYIYTDTATISLAAECVPSTLKVKPKKLVIKRRKSAVVTVTVKGENNEPCANHTVYASAENKKVFIDESTETNENGKAKFTVVAGDGKGKDVITFRTQDNDTEITKDINVIIK